jgi:glucose/mannose transport system substrate-binding protein
MVMTGQAGMQIMGDWAKGEFTAAGKQADVDYGCVLGPGEQLFQVGGDVFVFPKSDDPAVAEAQNKLARLMISPEGQVAFNNKKGSVPVRSDVDNSGMDPCAQKGLAVLSDPEKQVPSQNFLISPDANGLLQDAVSEFWNDPDMTADAFVEEVASILEGAA